MDLEKKICNLFVNLVYLFKPDERSWLLLRFIDFILLEALVPFLSRERERKKTMSFSYQSSNIISTRLRVRA